MLLNGCWYVQLTRVCPYGSNNTVRSVVLIFQLSAWTSSAPIPSIHPYPITGLESRGGDVVAIRIIGLSHLRISHLCPGNLVDEVQSFCGRLGIPFLRRIYSYVQFEVVTWMISQVGEKW